MRKNKTPRKPSTPEAKRQAALLCAAAIIAAGAMVVLANPWNRSDTEATSQTTQSTTTDTTRNDTDDLRQRAEHLFNGDAEQIAEDVRDLLNAPESSNVDTLSNLLYRHGRQDLAEASDLYDAIGRQDDIDTIRSLAREWYPQAMEAAIAARLEDLSSGLDSTAASITVIDESDLAGTQGCGDLKTAYTAAKQLVDSTSRDYDALTAAQQDLTSALSGCATNLSPSDLEKVFGQAQGTLKEDKE